MALIKIKPTARISLGLVFLTVSILLAGNLIGLIPDRAAEILSARQKLSESLAIQFSALTSKNDIPTVQTTLDLLVQRNSDVLSAAIRNKSGELVADAGDHFANWDTVSATTSTPDNVLVPVFKGRDRWGAVEIRFEPITSTSPLDVLGNSFIGLTLFVALSGFLGYSLFMKRSLRELDPSAVIPERVNAAFNALAEGVLILDENEHIVLANNAFAEKIGRPVSALIGKRASELAWQLTQSELADKLLPWTHAMQTGQSHTGARLILQSAADHLLTMMVNVAPILDGKGNNRGVLATFDDVTETENRNKELKETVVQLEKSRGEIEVKNLELEYLATRDPLTGCLNRRSFYAQFESLFDRARQKNLELSCIMTDIDHFKSVNDNYGHATGDKVIKLVADVLTANTRDEDLVGRYGGEEFCMVLPGLDIDQAAEVSERIRLLLKTEANKHFISGPHITSSFGVSSLTCGANEPAELVNKADEALYMSKEQGRNRVTQWVENPSIAQTHEKPPLEQATESERVDSSKVNGPVPATIDVNADEFHVERLQIRIKELEQDTEKLSELLQHYSSHDELTGLPSRLVFLDRILQASNRATRSSTTIAILSLDINMLDRINDTLGHVAGNQLLQQAAQRLNRVVRNTDAVNYLGGKKNAPTLSRLNGDEFVILLTDLKDKDAVIWIVKRLFEALESPILLDDYEIYMTCNIGISLFPDDGSDPEQLVKNASAARRHAKRQPGHNNYQFFSEDINQSSIQKLQVENQLRRGIEGDQFALHYQPKVDMQTGKISGVEALIRWEHPDMGLIPPNRFIPIAERTGLINPIGAWVMREACRQAKAWLEQGIHQIPIAVNLSAVQLRQANISDQIVGILNETGLEPGCIELEITESAIMENIDIAIGALRKLHDLGIKISIDDFGTGYSSLNYLKLFPVDVLKIDRSFIVDVNSDPHDAKIVSAIIAMAHSMELHVIAEGVETAEQLAQLQEMGCDAMQGYYFSRPVCADEATTLLTSRSVLKQPPSSESPGEICVLSSA